MFLLVDKESIYHCASHWLLGNSHFKTLCFVSVAECSDSYQQDSAFITPLRPIH